MWADADDEPEPTCDDQAHVFRRDDENWAAVTRETPCLCGAVTWGEMDDLLTLTTMWERPCRSPQAS